MGIDTVEVTTQEIEIKADKTNFIKILLDTVKNDDDLNGVNNDATWGETIDNGFESNIDLVEHKLIEGANNGMTESELLDLFCEYIEDLGKWVESRFIPSKHKENIGIMTLVIIYDEEKYFE